MVVPFETPLTTLVRLACKEDWDERSKTVSLELTIDSVFLCDSARCCIVEPGSNDDCRFSRNCHGSIRRSVAGSSSNSFQHRERIKADGNNERGRPVSLERTAA